ncbi:cryptochrome/photolyase family protein [Nocardioides sp.]|uniref:cryptochrome/photolyase family protein n=1 Tax=Nocardioides sp. TaxID=35761 RepID=UPI003515A0CE
MPPAEPADPAGSAAPVRLVLPHQLFAEHLQAAPGTRFVLVEHDLFYRQYPFHQQKLVLHRAGLRRLATRLEEAGFEVHHVLSDAAVPTREALGTVLRDLGVGPEPGAVEVYDVVDDWLARDLTATLADVGHDLVAAEVRESPNFLTTRAQIREVFGSGKAPRMQHFYAWQRRRLDVLMEGEEPRGGQWSFDADNRRKLPRNHPVPDPWWPQRHAEVEAAVAWVRAEFPDNPGDADAFRWPTAPEEAEAMLADFLDHRFGEFGPYEDALSARHPFVFHSLLTPALNVGLIDPRVVLERALEVGERDDIALPSLEGFVRQVIGWREYMRATYVLHGRRMRTHNRLEHGRELPEGWWTGRTGLAPVDLAVERVLAHGYSHHIERLMVLGNAMCLLRIDPDAVYEWFMAMYVDAYDWVMVPNVYAMSQFAAGEAITTKPYVSGSNYLRKMGDLPTGEWTADWDALYWTFVRDHRDVFTRNPRSSMIARLYDKLGEDKQAAHAARAARWLG